MASAQADISRFAAERQPAIRAYSLLVFSNIRSSLRAHFSCDLRSDPSRLRLRPRFTYTVIDCPGGFFYFDPGSALGRRYRATLFPNAPHRDGGFVFPGVILTGSQAHDIDVARRLDDS